jgi:hypothetical protein
MPTVPVQISPQGAFLNLLIGVSAPRAQSLQTTSQPIPQPQPARCLIDTGATCTVLDPRIIGPLGLTPTGQCPTHTASSGNTPHLRNQYDISVSIVLSATLSHTLATTLAALDGNFSQHGFDGLIGRDILGRYSFIYQGPQNQLILFC